jgi:hypothetical protein
LDTYKKTLICYNKEIKKAKNPHGRGAARLMKVMEKIGN